MGRLLVFLGEIVVVVLPLVLSGGWKRIGGDNAFYSRIYTENFTLLLWKSLLLGGGIEDQRIRALYVIAVLYALYILNAEGEA